MKALLIARGAAVQFTPAPPQRPLYFLPELQGHTSLRPLTLWIHRVTRLIHFSTRTERHSSSVRNNSAGHFPAKPTLGSPASELGRFGILDHLI